MNSTMKILLFCCVAVIDACVTNNIHFQLYVENTTVVIFDNLTLQCESDTINPDAEITYKWHRFGGSIPTGSIESDSGQLTIPRVAPEDQGKYYCMGIQLGHCAESNHATVTVDAIPSIIIQPASKAIKAGKTNVTAMSCEAVGMGLIYFQWERYHTVNNSWIKPSHRAVNITSPNLKFSEITEEDEGVYRCIITNDDGNVTSDNASIFVYGPPVITFISNHTVSLEGDKVNLLCVAINDVHANYSLQVNWYKENELITSNDSEHILIYIEADKTSRQLHSTLLFDPINRADNGTYTCRASNHPDLYSELKTDLNVEYAPYVSIVNRSPYMTNVGSVTLLYCRATGKPIPTVQWYKGGFPVNPIPSYFQQASSIPTDTPHTTVYTCVGINYAGNKKHTRSANITVIVKDFKPCRPLLKAPKKGRRTIIRMNGFAKHISFRCKSNYALIGESLATCKNNGKWSSTTPTCKKQR